MRGNMGMGFLGQSTLFEAVSGMAFMLGFGKE